MLIDRKTSIAVLTLLMVPVSSAHSVSAQQSNSWKIDEKTSTVEFSVKHFMLSSVSGRFAKFSGTVNYDGKDLSKANVTASINASSIDTKNQMRDDHLRANDILSVSTFPLMSFSSKRVVPKSDGHFDIIGNLNLHGVEKEIVLKATPLKPMTKDSSNKMRTGTVAEATLERKDFNVFVDKAVDKGGALVGDKVKVTLKIDLVQTDS